MPKKITINNVRKAECTINDIQCPKCKNIKETIYNQYGNFCENNTIKYMKLDYTSLKRTL